MYTLYFSGKADRIDQLAICGQRQNDSMDNEAYHIAHLVCRHASCSLGDDILVLSTHENTCICIRFGNHLHRLKRNFSFPTGSITLAHTRRYEAFFWNPTSCARTRKHLERELHHYKDTRQSWSETCKSQPQFRVGPERICGEDQQWPPLQNEQRHTCRHSRRILLLKGSLNKIWPYIFQDDRIPLLYCVLGNSCPLVSIRNLFMMISRMDKFQMCMFQGVAFYLS